MVPYNTGFTLAACVPLPRKHNSTMIQVTCSNCGIRIHVPSTVQGRKGICFGCGAHLIVPARAKHAGDVQLDFAEGTRIANRYTIIQPVGKGGMGVVYRADDTLVDEEVALKFMRPNLLRTQRGQKIFIHEAQIARRLRHENIVAVHDVSWTDEGILYLSMEFLKGYSMRGFLRKHRNDRRLIDVRLCVSLIAQILRALEYAHRFVVHRDLKPENIMLLPGEYLKVLDFGVAKAIDAEVPPDENPVPTPAPRRAPAHTETPSTDSGSGSSHHVAGTYAYTAPEQRLRRQVDFRSDIYAVGLIFYELLTLRTPIDKQVEIESVRNDVSPSLLAVLERALRMEKEGRWQSAAEFRSQLLDAFDYSYQTVSNAEAESSSGTAASTENMAYIEGGSFLMGSNDVREEAPEFEPHVEPFYMDKHPVTVEQYGAFLEATGNPEPRSWHDPRYNGPSQAVVGVNWADAKAYAAWAGKLLPTEMQWEFAARGRDNRMYPWGGLEPETTLCNFRDYLGMPSIVTMHEDGQTPDGICDMAGNVYEWTRDSFVPYSRYIEGVDSPPDVPLRVVRGGCWSSPAEDLRCTHRRGLFPESRLPTVGFRCVLPASRRPKE